MRRIAQLFRTPGKKLAPFITAGYPTLDSTVPLVLAAEEAGAHMVELGMPFSDPLADGPVIQATSQQALENGVTIPWILETVAKIRKQTELPLVLMGYTNPLRHMGLETFLDQAGRAGVDGLIIPDLPPDEGRDFYAQARVRGLSTIYLVAPNTPDDRIRSLGEAAEDLLYAVSILGVTGASVQARGNLLQYLARVRASTAVPFMVGFGIATPEDVRLVGALADGVVIGSALLTHIKEAAEPVAAAKEYLQTLVAALADTEAAR